MIRDVTQSQADILKTTQKTEKPEARGKGGQEGVVESRGTRGDRVTLSATEGETATYSKPMGAAQQIALKFSALKMTVSTLLSEQGGVGAIGGEAASSNDQLTQLFNKLGISTTIDIGGGNTADLANLSQADAQKLIAPDGYWGVEQTSDRIVSFALNAAGGDPERLERVKQAVMKGYEMAKEAFGGYLPDISQQTIDAVMVKLDKAVTQGDQKVSV